MENSTSHPISTTREVAESASVLLARLRAEREMRRLEKEAAEERLHTALRIAHSLQQDVERAAVEFKAAEGRVGETRSRMRAIGLLYVTSR